MPLSTTDRLELNTSSQNKGSTISPIDLHRACGAFGTVFIPHAAAITQHRSQSTVTCGRQSSYESRLSPRAIARPHTPYTRLISHLTPTRQSTGRGRAGCDSIPLCLSPLPERRNDVREGGENENVRIFVVQIRSAHDKLETATNLRRPANRQGKREASMRETFDTGALR